MATLIMKFGGTLTADVKRITRVAQIIHAESLAWNRMVVVVSAAAGVTDSFAQAADEALSGSTRYRRIVGDVRQRHIELLDALFSQPNTKLALVGQMDHILFSVLTACDRAATQREEQTRVRDAVMAAGEQLMVCLLVGLVRQEGLRAASVDAGSLIITDDSFQNAHPLMDLVEERADSILRPMLDAGIVPIVAGFVGATRNGAITTLGRGGSDYTATLLGAALRADEIWIWSSVDGIMSADPQIVPIARVLPVLSYEEVSELAYFGARILHPRAIEPLQPGGIPLRVRNPFNLDHAGTLIQSEPTEYTTPLKAVSAVDGICLYTSGRSIDMTAFLAEVRRLVGQTADGPVIVLQSHFRSVLVFVIPTSEGPAAVASAVQRLTAGLGHWNVLHVKVIALMGTLAMTDAISGFRPIASAVGPGDRQILAVAPQATAQIVRQLHKLTEATEQQILPVFNTRTGSQSPPA